MNCPPARIGDRLDEVETPALIIDMNAFERNLARMAEHAKRSGMHLRPHAKTHRCPAIALQQVAAGAIGASCQTVGEAACLVNGGIRDVLVCNEIVSPGKLARLAELAARARISLCFDHADQVALASQAAVRAGVELGGLIELDLGMRRCGIADIDEVVSLAKRVDAAPGLRFDGLQAYHGSAQHWRTEAERAAGIGTAAALVRAAIDALSAAGLPCKTVSGAGTGTYRHESASGVWTELQAGSYLFMDAEYGQIEGVDGEPFREFEFSLFVLASVISNVHAGSATLDAGLKSISGEKGLPWPHELPGARITKMSDEHSVMVLDQPGQRLALGQRIRLIPGHCDPTVNLHDWYVAVRDGRVAALWRIAARGASH